MPLALAAANAAFVRRLMASCCAMTLMKCTIVSFASGISAATNFTPATMSAAMKATL